jgi:uncharacterized membrane protein YqaE (UPF0057 family)
MANKVDKYIKIFNKYFAYCPNDTNYTLLEWFENYWDWDSNVDDENGFNLEYVKNSLILINNHHLINPNVKLNDIFDKLQVNSIHIEIMPRIKGGGLVDMFMSIIQIGKVFLMLGDLIIWLIKFVAWFIMFIVWLLKFLFVDLIVDFWNSIVIIVITIFRIPIDLFTGLVAWGMNAIGGWMTSIFGWDQSGLTKNDKNSNYFKGIDRMKGKKCYLTNSNTVPFSILLGTIICPPVGVFMDLGISGWFNILICIILTLMYYIPGLFYALLVIYS